MLHYSVNNLDIDSKMGEAIILPVSRESQLVTMSPRPPPNKFHFFLAWSVLLLWHATGLQTRDMLIFCCWLWSWILCKQPPSNASWLHVLHELKTLNRKTCLTDTYFCYLFCPGGKVWRGPALQKRVMLRVGRLWSAGQQPGGWWAVWRSGAFCGWWYAHHTAGTLHCTLSR